MKNVEEGMRRGRLSETKSQFQAPLLGLAVFFLSGCSSLQPGVESRAQYLMGTTCRISVDAAHAGSLDRAFAEIARIETQISTWRDDSELSRLNASPAGQPVKVSDDLYDLLATAHRWAQKSGGAFNPLMRPLIDAWKTREEGALPDQVLLAAAKSRTDLANLAIDEAKKTITLRNDARIEEGGFGKGYAIDRAIEVLEGEEAEVAIIDFGGQIASRSAAPVRVAIAHPESRDLPALELSLDNASLSTSSGSEKQFTIDGRAFSHIIDPRSGEALPPRGSASAIHHSALIADILSTTLYVLGSGEGLRWADANGIAAIFLTPRNGTYDVLLSAAARRLPLGIRPLHDQIKTKE